MNKATVELKFTCGCGYVVTGNSNHSLTTEDTSAVEAAQSHAEEFGHRLHVEGTVTPSEKRMQVKRMHRAKRAQLALPSFQEKIHEQC